LSTSEANEQHYEVPSEFFKIVLDQKSLKYSCCYFGWDGQGRENKNMTLEEAGEAMMKLYINRANISNGHTILDLGCGWGSLSLFLALQFPASKITSVSNSKTQKQFIEGKCKELNITNVEVITADVNVFETNSQFDRILSIEMFEHMKNYEKLLGRISSWLKPTGKLFVHIFSHASYPYHFIPQSDSDWMARHFFTNGTMPSDDLLLYFQKDLHLEEHWRVDGRNYGTTSRLWLQNMDKNLDKIRPIFENTYGKEDAYKWIIRWRLFFISVEETFNYKEGSEWFVSHYLFGKSRSRL